MSHKLLLADDSLTIHRVIEATFAGQDVTVISAMNGREAIERIDRDPPDIVLADIGMPERDGFDVASHVKTSPRLAHIPVLLLTGAFETVDKDRVRAAGCDGVLGKPFEPQMVISRVRELLVARPMALVAGDPSTADRVAPAGGAPADDGPVLTGSAGEALPAAASFDDHVPAPGESLDDYFDRLDRQLANRQPPILPAMESAAAGLAPAGAAVAAVWEPPVFAGPEPAPVAPAARQAVVLERQSSQPAGPPASCEADVGSQGGAAQEESAERFDADVAADEAPEDLTGIGVRDAHAAADTAGVAPGGRDLHLADAFAALLAAERGEPGVPGVPLPWRTRSEAPAVTEELVEEIVRRVIDRLSDRTIRDTVSEVVLQVAERLVREEIERIKAAAR